MPKVIQVIESIEKEGKGTVENPYRETKCFYSLEGDLLIRDESYMYHKLNSEYDRLNEEYIKLSADYNALVMAANKHKALREIASRRKK